MTSSPEFRLEAWSNPVPETRPSKRPRTKINRRASMATKTGTATRKRKRTGAATAPRYKSGAKKGQSKPRGAAANPTRRRKRATAVAAPNPTRKRRRAKRNPIRGASMVRTTGGTTRRRKSSKRRASPTRRRKAVRASRPRKTRRSVAAPTRRRKARRSKAPMRARARRTRRARRNPVAAAPNPAPRRRRRRKSRAVAAASPNRVRRPRRRYQRTARRAGRGRRNPVDVNGWDVLGMLFFGIVGALLMRGIMDITDMIVMAIGRGEREKMGTAAYTAQTDKGKAIRKSTRNTLMAVRIIVVIAVLVSFFFLAFQRPGAGATSEKTSQMLRSMWFGGAIMGFMALMESLGRMIFGDRTIGDRDPSTVGDIWGKVFRSDSSPLPAREWELRYGAEVADPVPTGTVFPNPHSGGIAVGGRQPGSSASSGILVGGRSTAAGLPVSNGVFAQQLGGQSRGLPVSGKPPMGARPNPVVHPYGQAPVGPGASRGLLDRQLGGFPNNALNTGTVLQRELGGFTNTLNGPARHQSSGVFANQLGGNPSSGRSLSRGRQRGKR